MLNESARSAPANGARVARCGARVARCRNCTRVARWWTHIGFPRKMTPRLPQPPFFSKRATRAGTLRVQVGTRASALRAHGTHNVSSLTTIAARFP